MGCATSKPEPENGSPSFDGCSTPGVTKDTGGFPLRRPRSPPPEYSALVEKGWPEWLVAVAGDVIGDWTPCSANSFLKIEKIGEGSYSNVYKARNKLTGKVVAMKKVRFEISDPSSVEFMAREIRVLKKLNHPNVIRLEGLAISRISCGLYLIFEYMEHDLTSLIDQQVVRFTEPEVKCYMKQLLSGLEHCHNNGVLHRDIKCCNLLISDEGILKIADFGLASFFDPLHSKPMTPRVVTLWYRAPDLLLGNQYYGVGVDLWSAGCILAELFIGGPIFPGRSEVQQLRLIFELCGTPSEECWTKLKVENASLYKSKQRCILETFKYLPSSSLTLIDTLLSMDPDKRGTTTAALNSEFFTSEPYACLPSSLQKYTPRKKKDLEFTDDKARRQSGATDKAGTVNSIERVRASPQVDAEIQSNLEFFTLEPYACQPSSLQKYTPSKEIDLNFTDDKARRESGATYKSGTANSIGRVRARNVICPEIPTPQADADIQSDLERLRILSPVHPESKREKSPGFDLKFSGTESRTVLVNRHSFLGY